MFSRQPLPNNQSGERQLNSDRKEKIQKGNVKGAEHIKTKLINAIRWKNIQLYTKYS